MRSIVAYGYLTPEMKKAIRPHVKGKLVVDLGAGDLTNARMLARMGADVIAIDKEPMPEHPTILTWQSTFEDFERLQPSVEVAFVSWPCNWRQHGLGNIIDRARCIIYLGLNDNKFTACGGPGFWAAATRHQLLKSIDHPKNNLLIWGEVPRSAPYHREEQVAMSHWFPNIPKWRLDEAS